MSSDNGNVYELPSLFEILKADRALNEDNDRDTMYSRSPFSINDRWFGNACEGATSHGVSGLRTGQQVSLALHDVQQR